MPLIRCPRCARAYDIPPEVAVRLPSSIARCDCGEWICGNRERLIQRVLGDGALVEIDLQPFAKMSEGEQRLRLETEEEPFDTGEPRHIRVVAKTATGSLDQVFTITDHPLWIGRKGSHIEFEDAELSIRHCAIERRGSELWLRDADSHTGTFLDGEPVSEERLHDGMHIVRAGSAMLCVESSEGEGVPVEPIAMPAEEALDGGAILRRRLEERRQKDAAALVRKAFLICLEGPSAGKEFEIPDGGLIVGREGDVRVNDDYLSRRHFAVERDPEGTLRVRDLGSRNGTFLNTLPARNTRIHPGDEIRAGVNRFRVEERAAN